MRRERSSPAETRKEPQGEKERDQTVAVCAERVAMQDHSSS